MNDILIGAALGQPLACVCDMLDIPPEQRPGRPSLQARAAAAFPDGPPPSPRTLMFADDPGLHLLRVLWFCEQAGVNAYAEAEKLIAHRERQLALAEAAVADPAMLDAATEKVLVLGEEGGERP